MEKTYCDNCITCKKDKKYIFELYNKIYDSFSGIVSNVERLKKIKKHI